MFSQRSHYDPSPNALSRLIAEKRAAGAPLIDLTAANPTAAGIVYDNSAILDALSQPDCLVYAPDPRGLSSARRAVAGYYAAIGVPVDPGAVFLTPGTSDGYAAVLTLLADPGEEILIPEPGYPLLSQLAAFEGLTTVGYPLRYDPVDGWCIDLEVLRALVSPATRAIVAVSPSNPTGQYLKRREGAVLEEICIENDLALIVDEVFSDYGTPVNAGDRVRCAAVGGRALTFVLGGFSKMLGLPQMKLAWVIASGHGARSAGDRLEFLLDFYLATGTPVQIAAEKLLGLRSRIQRQIRDRVDGNFAHLQRLTENAGGCRVLLREGGWTAVLQFDDGLSDDERVLAALAEDDVIVHPGYFYDFASDGYLVVGLLAPPERFQTAAERLLQRFGC